MISATEPNSADMATPSAFSYAQAAKGQGTTPSNSSPNPVSPALGANLSSSATDAPFAAEKPVEALESTRSPDTRDNAGNKHDEDGSLAADGDLRLEPVQEKRIESRRDDEAGRLDRPWRRNDKGTRSSSATTRSIDEQESRRPRKGKKTKASEKQSGDQASAAEKESATEPEAPKIELSEAPIPSVNIWHQRKEQLTKMPPPYPCVQDDKSNSALSKPEEAKKSTTSVEDASATVVNKESPSSANGTKAHRKQGDAARAERNGSRGARSTVEKESRDGKSEVPPSVDDATAWPTPETAIKEDKKKASDKSDRSDKSDTVDDAAHSKARQKEKWVTYDYVPTVNFETQLPQLRSSKPRGGARGANGTRSTANSQAGEKASSVATTTKVSESRDRPRESGNGAVRTTSLPPAGKRIPMDTSSSKEQRKPLGNSNAEKSKDSAPNTSAEQSNTTRPEGRGDRGRGGYRGRGGHHAVNTHSQHHGTPNFAATGPMSSRNQGPYSPTLRQGAHGQMFMPPTQRGGRGRNGAGNNFHRMSLPNAGVSRLPQLQAQFGPYEYPMAPMSAIPFQPPPYWDNVVLSLLKNQIEYYFSIENLCKDVFLRKRMDSQGFVHLHFIAAFKRIQDLSVDMAMIRAVCETSNEIDFVAGEDEVERVRRRSGWESFVLPMEDRDSFAQNDGPMHITTKSRGYQVAPQFNGIPPVPFGMASPPNYPLQVDTYQQHPAEPTPGHGVNGLTNGFHHGPTSQLSANVPDFSPSGSFAIDEQAKKLSTQTDRKANDAASSNTLINGVHGDESSSHLSGQS